MVVAVVAVVVDAVVAVAVVAVAVVGKTKKLCLLLKKQQRSTATISKKSLNLVCC